MASAPVQDVVASVPAAPPSAEGDAAAALASPTAATPATTPAEAPVESAEAEQQEPAPPAVDPAVQAFNDQLKAARESPSDFDQWTKLITATEKLGDITKLREVYDDFLAEFPLCYGYWKKYADAEVRAGAPEQAAIVFQRGVAAVPYSVDLWGHYTTFRQNQQAEPDDVRGIFEQGLAYVGTDFLSHSLWDKYISFELSKNETGRVAQLYQRLLATPIRDLDRYHTSFVEFAGARPASSMLAPEEHARISAAASWLAGLEQVYQGTKQEQGRRQPFEGGIKRPYFHIKPLDTAQLSNWTRYLDFAEKAGDPGATLRLYERCLVPCASYAEYWSRYARYLEDSGDVEGARAAIQRATLVHCKQQPAAHLHAGLFEERHKNIEAARAAIVLAQEKLAPGLLAAIVARANFERRQEQRSAACAVFADAIEREGAAKEGQGSTTYPFLVLQYAAFLLAAFKDATAARELLNSALASHPGLLRLWEGAIHFEDSVAAPDRAERVMSLYKRATSGDSKPALTDAERKELSERSVTFADLHCDANAAEQAAAAHASLARLLAPKADAKKRTADDAAGGPAAKQAKVQPASQAADPAAASAAMQHPAQAAAAGYYGQQGYNYSGYYPYQAPAQQYSAAYPGYGY
ncbi:hypothetical protein WJX73_004772 [Symbiochloris irregularis]|uniref:Suppressor of forked domain-containing protein n=1 Tax=Symbiochloris irregularis TaxID=706552 RepID=A0AAW1PA59_9CHLO